MVLRCFPWLVLNLDDSWESQIELAGSVLGGQVSFLTRGFYVALDLRTEVPSVTSAAGLHHSSPEDHCVVDIPRRDSLSRPFFPHWWELCLS